MTGPPKQLCYDMPRPGSFKQTLLPCKGGLRTNHLHWESVKSLEPKTGGQGVLELSDVKPTRTSHQAYLGLLRCPFPSPFMRSQRQPLRAAQLPWFVDLWIPAAQADHLLVTKAVTWTNPCICFGLFLGQNLFAKLKAFW